MNKTYYRNCPDCQKKVEYKLKVCYNAAVKNNSKCRTCCRKGLDSTKFALKLTDEILDKISDMYKQGFSKQEMSEKLNIHRATLLKAFKKLGFKINPVKIIEYVGTSQIKCQDCKQIQDLKFYTKMPYGYMTFCKQCAISRRYFNLNNNSHRYFKFILGRIKRQAAKAQVPFDLDLEYLENLADAQKYKCVYTKQKLNMSQGIGPKRDSLSVDRINFDKGYVKNNVVLCTTRANCIKSDMSIKEFKLWMPLWFKNLKEFSKCFPLTIQ